MSDVQITVRSLTYGQKGIRLLHKAGITAYLRRAPKKIAEYGCGYSIGLREKSVRNAVEVLRNNAIPISGVWRENEDGEYERAEL